MFLNESQAERVFILVSNKARKKNMPDDDWSLIVDRPFFLLVDYLLEKIIP